MDPTLLLFLKAPDPGQVKTRLAKDLGERAAADAYIGMARAVRDMTARLEDIRLLWVYAPSDDHPDLRWLELPSAGFWPQADGDLGERLAAAFKHAFADFGGPVCAIGMDSPGLPTARVREAFRALTDHDAVLGPTEDGGYYLIGTAQSRPALFTGIPWSTGEVMKRTLARAKEEGLSTHVLPEFFDVDTLADYRRWMKDPFPAPDGTRR